MTVTTPVFLSICHFLLSPFSLQMIVIPMHCTLLLMPSHLFSKRLLVSSVFNTSAAVNCFKKGETIFFGINTAGSAVSAAATALGSSIESMEDSSSSLIFFLKLYQYSSLFIIYYCYTTHMYFWHIGFSFFVLSYFISISFSQSKIKMLQY